MVEIGFPIEKGRDIQTSCIYFQLSNIGSNRVKLYTLTHFAVFDRWIY